MNGTSLSEINNKLEYIIQKLDSLETKITNIEENLNIIDKKTEKIDFHLDFGVKVYDSLKTPLNFFSDKVNNYIGKKTIKLPEIDYHNNNNFSENQNSN